MENENVKPLCKFSTGAVEATIWKNVTEKDGKTFGFNTISLTRKYKDSEENWKYTNSLRLNDLPKAITVLQKAYEFMVLKNDARGGING